MQWLRPVSQQPPSSPPHKRKRFAFAIMSHSYLTADSTSNFQLIINNALKAYESHTKKDLLVHPLAAQFQACNSPADILAILQRQVQDLDQSRSKNDRWTKWLDPTVGVLYALSETLGEGVALVSLRTCTCMKPASSYIMAGILARESYICGTWCPSLSAYPSLYFCEANIASTYRRQRRMFGETKIH